MCTWLRRGAGGVTFLTQERDDESIHSNQHGDGEALLRRPSVYKLALGFYLHVTPFSFNVNMFRVTYAVVSGSIQDLPLLLQNIFVGNGIR